MHISLENISKEIIEIKAKLAIINDTVNKPDSNYEDETIKYGSKF